MKDFQRLPNANEGIDNHGSLTLTNSKITGNGWHGVWNQSGTSDKTSISKNCILDSNSLCGLYDEAGTVVIENSETNLNGQFGIANNGTTSVNSCANSGNRSGPYQNVQGTLTVSSPGLSRISFSNSSVSGGQVVMATLILTSPALAGGLVVNLSTSDGSVASCQPTVTFNKGQTSVQFQITTVQQKKAVPVTIIATAGQVIAGTAPGCVVEATLTVG